MPKITFMGAGSTIFAKAILGDVMLSEPLRDSHIALYDIDATRLEESRRMLSTLNDNINEGRARITAHAGVGRRRTALRGAAYVVNAIQVGGYEPSTVIDFEIPAQYGLRQTIADTLGIGGIFRALRTIPVMLDFARDMEQVCPGALMLNYTNPMAMLSAAMQQATGIATVGLCHSVQGCAEGLLKRVALDQAVARLRWKIAGINHQAWLLEIGDGDTDLYPKIKREARRRMRRVMEAGPARVMRRAKERAAEGERWWEEPDVRVANDLVRLQIMLDFGYYVTESSEHNAEYMPFWIKARYPELIERYNIPLDEYPRRCVAQIEGWKKQAGELVENPVLTHERSHEYGSRIMEAMETDVPVRIGGNVLNHGLIDNLPRRACVEVPCLVDRNGVQGCHVGRLPEQCAALNRTNINVQLLTIEAALTKKKEHIYQAAMLDPHTAAELPIDTIRRMCDELIEAHGAYLPKYR
jgi:alpha-galactosidase